MLDIRITDNKVYPKEAPPAKSVAQLPGSIYPPATKKPGHMNARKFCQNPFPAGTGIVPNTSERDFILGLERQGLDITQNFVQFKNNF
jgi:hypothetical protein